MLVSSGEFIGPIMYAIVLLISELSHLIIRLAQSQGRITTYDIVLATDANRNTIKKHLQKLTLSGQLLQYGVGRGVWYSLAWIS